MGAKTHGFAHICYGYLTIYIQIFILHYLMGFRKNILQWLIYSLGCRLSGYTSIRTSIFLAIFFVGVT